MGHADLEVLNAEFTLRFTEIGRRVSDISQRMLSKTLRHMEREGLVSRVAHPVIPPHVDYSLTDLGRSLAAAFRPFWVWADNNHVQLEKAHTDSLAREMSEQKKYVM